MRAAVGVDDSLARIVRHTCCADVVGERCRFIGNSCIFFKQPVMELETAEIEPAQFFTKKFVPDPDRLLIQPGYLPVPLYFALPEYIAFI